MVEIKKHLDEYLEFDSDLLFDKMFIDFNVIFGGAIRDIVSGDFDKINDIDILSMPISTYHIFSALEENGYKKLNLVKPDIQSIYKNIKFIFEPITFMNKNQKIVQIIRPSHQNSGKGNIGTFECGRDSFFNLLKNVDLSSSGLFYDGEDIFESVDGSYIHCKSKVFESHPSAMMFHTERTSNRKTKLVQEKGWYELISREGEDFKTTVSTIINRKLKLHQLKKYEIQSIDDYIKKMRSYYKRLEKYPEQTVRLIPIYDK